MNLDYFTGQMAHNAQKISALVQGVSDEQARWKPDPASWSILEVINHLNDEEREDFRVRLDYILHRPGQAWPGIDPQEWITARQYNRQDFGGSLDNFLTARQQSLAWLQDLEPPDWEAVYEAPFGQITAGDLFAAWVAHDLLHLRQLVELNWAYTVDRLAPYKPDYGGTW